MIDVDTARMLRRAAADAADVASNVTGQASQPGVTKKEAAKLATITSQLYAAARGLRYLAGEDR